MGIIKVPGTISTGPNTVVIQAVNTWLGTWCVPNDSASQQTSPRETVHLPIIFLTMASKCIAHSFGGLRFSYSCTASCSTFILMRTKGAALFPTDYKYESSALTGSWMSHAWHEIDTFSTFAEFANHFTLQLLCYLKCP